MDSSYTQQLFRRTKTRKTDSRGLRPEIRPFFARIASRRHQSVAIQEYFAPKILTTHCETSRVKCEFYDRMNRVDELLVRHFICAPSAYNNNSYARCILTVVQYCFFSSTVSFLVLLFRDCYYYFVHVPSRGERIYKIIRILIRA